MTSIGGTTSAAGDVVTVNPSIRSANVEVTVHTSTGGLPASGLEEFTLDAGAMLRVDLAGALPQGVTEAAITVRSNGVPVNVSAGTRVTAEAVEDTGFAVQLGAPATDDRWIVSGLDPAGRTESIVVVNPESEDATVVVGLDVVAEGGAGPVRTRIALGTVEVPAGASRLVRVAPAIEGVLSWSATVVATDGRVVVGRVGTGGQGLDLVAVPGVAAWSWSAPSLALTHRQRPGLTRRLGTSLDLDERPGEPTATEPRG
jgi:hypothetical protein